MEKALSALRRLLRPSRVLAAVLTVVSTVCLVLIFVKGWEHTLFAYMVYPLSAYCAGVVAYAAGKAFQWGKQRLHENRHYRRYATDLHFKAEVSLYFSLAVTFFFSVFKAAAGIYYRSAWLGSVAAYYILLAVMRYLLSRRIRCGKTGGSCRACGVLLLVLTAALGSISFYSIYRGNAVRYPGFLIYAAAAFTFYQLTMAIWNLLRYRTLRIAVYTASKILALASSLVSLFFLQTAMFRVFGDGGAWQQTMNLATGGAVYLIILVLAVQLLRGSSKQ
ncbi:MAG: hypothetical protein IJA51_06750 [Oscillospiraceae bacterium]|nr:hypothetical protein [Oscillospiraceae bacterium]